MNELFDIFDVKVTKLLPQGDIVGVIIGVDEDGMIDPSKCIKLTDKSDSVTAPTQ